MKHFRTLSLASLLALAAACGGHGPKADKGKSREDIKAAAKKMSDSQLEKVIEEYKEALGNAKDDKERMDLVDKASIYTTEYGTRKMKEMSK